MISRDKDDAVQMWVLGEHTDSEGQEMVFGYNEKRRHPVCLELETTPQEHGQVT